MGELLLYAFYLFLFYWVIKKKAEFIYFIPLFGLGMDMSFNLFEGFSIPAYVRGAIFFIFFLAARKYVSTNRFFLPFYLFFGWIFFLLTQSAEFMYSFKAVIQVVFSMLTFIVAYNYFNTQQKLFRLLHGLFWVVVVAIVATSLGYLFGIGQSFDYLSKYDEEEDVIGLLGSSGLYAPGMVISLLPLILKTQLKPYQKVLFPVFCLMLFVFMLLTLRRTVMFIPIVGLIGFFLYTSQRGRMLRFFGIALTVLLLTYPLYEGILLQRFEARKDTGRFDEDFYKTEQRYLENVYIVEQIATFDEPGRLLFGYGNNLFAENIEDGKITGRMFHTDFAKLIYSVGLFGFLIYLAIYLALYRKISRIPNIKAYSDYKAAALGLYLISVFVSFNGSVTIITFRSIFFLLLGAILGYIKYTSRLDTDQTLNKYSG